MRSRLLALAAGLLVVVGLPLFRLLGRATDPAPGDLDLSDAWSWPPVIAAGLATSAAVFFWSLHRTSARREPAPHETFEYHDAMLQSAVAARMALELDEPARAEGVLDGVIASAGQVVSAFADQRGAVLRARHTNWCRPPYRRATTLVLAGEGTGRGDVLPRKSDQGEER